MKISWRNGFSAVVIATTVIIVVLSFCANCAESRPSPSASLLEKYLEIDFVQPDYDYEYPDFIQGPRRRRWAFPGGPEDAPCPVGEKLHSSGYRCVPDNDREDDY